MPGPREEVILGAVPLLRIGRETDGRVWDLHDGDGDLARVAGVSVGYGDVAVLNLIWLHVISITKEGV